MSAFDLERATRRFYERYSHERDALAAQVGGLPDDEARRGYAALLMGRLMCLCFVQARGLLAGDRAYLRRRLEQSAVSGADRFYAELLCPLFFDALARRPFERSAAIRALVGDVPFLGGGVFEQSLLEQRYGERIRVPDRAFAALFDFFELYRWHPDERPPRADNELSPAVLGYVFEKQISQKQLGAYYTSDDVADYISRSTILPRLLDQVGERCPDSWPAVLALLRAQPERYIYPALGHGTEQPLPAEIAAGIADAGRRAAWNQTAPDHYGLPGEIWRETIDRRRRHADIHAAIRGGQIVAPSDLVTHNLDLQRLAQDAITRCADPALLLAWWRALAHIRVLDPACGAGAFLFAALRVLEPLYDACLDRMGQLVPKASGDAASAFRAALADANARPSRRSFVLGSIMANNLFGVDIMEEAVALCRLRLHLLLVAQLDTPPQSERLPDLSANIRAGNALVGFATGGDAVPRDALNQCLAREYGVDPQDGPAYRRWLGAHRPFHWPVEFPRPLARGGFDAIIGNPPYVPYSSVRRDYTVHGYATERAGNLYALTVERALGLLREGGRCGMIVPIASVSTDGMAALQRRYAQLDQWHSHYAVRPGKLFAGVDMNLTISLLHNKGDGARSYVTGYRRWSGGAAGDRPFVFPTLAYVRNPRLADHANPYPKLQSPVEEQILRRMLGHGRKLGGYTQPSGTTLFYHSGGRYWRKALPQKLSSHYKPITVAPELAPLAFGLLNSQLFYWYWISNSNCMDVVSREVLDLPVFALEAADPRPFAALMERLLAAYATGATTRVRRGQRIRSEELNFDAGRAKPIVDAIDQLLARHYGFGDDELDFVLNYDIKYRVAAQRAL